MVRQYYASLAWAGPQYSDTDSGFVYQCADLAEWNALWSVMPMYSIPNKAALWYIDLET